MEEFISGILPLLHFGLRLMVGNRNHRKGNGGYAETTSFPVSRGRAVIGFQETGSHIVLTYCCLTSGCCLSSSSF